MKRLTQSKLRTLERLETRDAPATLADAKTVTYQDVDGDDVVVRISKPLFVAATINNVFDFATGSVNGNNASKQQLWTIDLSFLAATGASLTLTATRSTVHGGDGFANLGFMNAANLDLANVTIDGDLGRLSAGDGNFDTTGLVSLRALSMGRFGVSTQSPGGDLQTTILGKVGSIGIRRDVIGAEVLVTGNANTSLGRLTIGGALVGSDIANSGEFIVNGNIGVALIRGNIEGGDGADSGRISSLNNILNVAVGGSLLGGLGQGSAGIFGAGGLGQVRVRGSLVGGLGGSTAQIGTNSGGDMGSVTIGGSIIGATNGGTGVLCYGNLDSLTVKGDVQGGTGSTSAQINCLGTMAHLAIFGSLIGSSGGNSAQILGDSIGSIRIGHDVLGGFGSASGNIFASTTIGSVTIGGSVVGGDLTYSGNISSDGDIGPVFIGGDVKGGSGTESGIVRSTNGAIAGVTVGRSLSGGTGPDSGEIRSRLDLGPVKIGHNVVGGSDQSTGLVRSEIGKIASVTIGGSLVGGFGNFTGEIFAGGSIGPIKIGRDLIGGNLQGLNDITNTGYIQGQRIASVFVGGNVVAGSVFGNQTLTKSGSIRAIFDIGPITVKGSLVGNSDMPVIITARGQQTPGTTTNVAIASVRIDGRVEHAQILAGYDTILTPINADAQIGPVIIGKDWVASSLIAGAHDGADNLFGTNDDAKISGGSATIVSRIASVIIKGQALGTGDVGGDHFGIVAQQIGSLQVEGRNFALSAGLDNVAVGVTGDLNVREVA